MSHIVKGAQLGHIPWRRDYTTTQALRQTGDKWSPQMAQWPQFGIYPNHPGRKNRERGALFCAGAERC
jgi:hypothetical protein